jgi:hypothetical protein
LTAAHVLANERFKSKQPHLRGHAAAGRATSRPGSGALRMTDRMTEAGPPGVLKAKLKKEHSASPEAQE